MSKSKGDKKAGSSGGVTDFASLETMMYGDVEDDDELMSELLALQAEEEDSPPPRAPARSRERVGPSKEAATRQGRAPPTAAATADLATIGRLARQLSVEADVRDDDADPSVDHDPQLLGELRDLLVEDEAKPPKAIFAEPPPRQQPAVQKGKSGAVDQMSLLQDRLRAYEAAETAAKAAGDGSKARRMGRGVSTLRQLVQRSRAGHSIDPEDIPVSVKGPRTDGPGDARTPAAQPFTDDSPKPAVVTKPPAEVAKKQDAPVKPAPKPPPVAQPDSVKDPQLTELRSRRDAYKRLAVAAKGGGDTDTAVAHLRAAKALDAALQRLNQGDQVDLATLPTSPSAAATPKKAQLPLQQTATAETTSPQSTKASAPQRQTSVPPQQPTSTKEALEARLGKYEATAAAARTAGDERRARQSDRIAGQYRAALRDLARGRPVDVAAFPSLPGFPPIPPDDNPPSATGSGGPAPSEAAPPPRPPQSSAVPEKRVSVGGGGQEGPAATVTAGPTPPKQSRQEQQLDFLIHRQAQFKQAALFAKKRADLPAAKELLRQAKGFDEMIAASRNGVRVDISGVPTPPQLQTNQAVLRTQLSRGESQDGTSSVAVDGGRDEVLGQLERDLIRQVQLCERNQLYFTRVGDVAEVRRFERLALDQKRDLVALRNAARHGDPLPRFRYETRSMPSLECCADLTDEEMELAIVKCIQLKAPSGYEEGDMDVFVKFEFPFPPDAAQTGKTHSVKASLSPVFNERVKLMINRKSKQLQRVFNRRSIKFEVWQRGGWLRSDKSLGTGELKLSALETKSEVHETVDLRDGRRPCGGKIEARLRLREPLQAAVAAETNEKWLVIDHFMAPVKPPPLQPAARAPILPKIPLDRPKEQPRGLRRMD